MNANDWQEIQQSLGDAAARIRAQIETLPENHPPLRERLNQLLSSIDALNHDEFPSSFPNAVHKVDLVAYRSKLANALRPLSDPVEIQAVATQTLGEYLRASRVLYAEVLDDGNTITIAADYCAEGVPSVVGEYQLDAFGTHIAATLLEGQSLVVASLNQIKELTSEVLTNYKRVNISAYITVPLIKNQRLMAFMTLQQDTPRDWTADEVLLVEATAERTWAAVEQAYAEKALVMSEARYRMLFNSIDEGFTLIKMLFDEHRHPVDYLFLEVNSTFERQTGIKDAVGKRIRDIYPLHEQYWFDIYGKVALTGEPLRFENHAEQLHRYFDVYAFRVGDASDQTVAVLFNDITERKHREDELKKSAAFDAFRLMLADAMRTLTDPVDIQVEACRVLGKQLQVSRVRYGEIADDKVHVAVQQDYTDAVENLPRHFPLIDFGAVPLDLLNDGRTLMMPDTFREPLLSEAERAHYQSVAVGAQVVVPLVKADQLVAVFYVHQKMPRVWTPEEVRLIEETAERTWAAVAHARQAIQAQELAVLKDRQNLARELHDAVSQTLFSASVLSETILRLWNRDNSGEKVPQLLGTLNQQVKGAMAEMRVLLLELRPSNVQSTSFTQLMHYLAESVSSRKLIDIELQFDGQPELPIEVHVMMYRIAQEVINNVIKHSQATKVWMEGCGGAGFVELRIRDNGVGFQTDQAPTGLGIQIMRERANEIGAQFDLHSDGETGTVVYILWPHDATSHLSPHSG